MAETVNSSSPARMPLSERIPLKQPLAIHIFPSYYCNFKCFYCIHNLDDEHFAELGLKKQFMSMETLKRTVDSCIKFSDPMKVAIFAGHGEPLLNKELPDMIRYASESKAFERTELVTNGALLTEERSLQIINSGLSVLRISIQGLNSIKYRKISGVDLDFDKFVQQIEFFYKNRKNCNMYIKIVDASLDEGEEKRFYETFGKICDRIAIEHVVPTAHGIDYSKTIEDTGKTQQGYESRRTAVCPMPFYMMVIEPDGNVRTCCATKFPILNGNVNKDDLSSLWKSHTLKKFWQMLLAKKRFEDPICSKCTNPDYGIQPGDSLDAIAEELLKKIES